MSNDFRRSRERHREHRQKSPFSSDRQPAHFVSGEVPTVFPPKRAEIAKILRIAPLTSEEIFPAQSLGTRINRHLAAVPATFWRQTRNRSEAFAPQFPTTNPKQGAVCGRLCSRVGVCGRVCGVCARVCAYRVGERVGPLPLLCSVRGTIGVLGVAGVFFGLGVVTAAGVACRRSGLVLFLDPMSLVEVSTASQRRLARNMRAGEILGCHRIFAPHSCKKYIYIY